MLSLKTLLGIREWPQQHFFGQSSGSPAYQTREPTPAKEEAVKEGGEEEISSRPDR
jgi:hypothetical protein